MFEKMMECHSATVRKWGLAEEELAKFFWTGELSH